LFALKVENWHRLLSLNDDDNDTLLPKENLALIDKKIRSCSTAYEHQIEESETYETKHRKTAPVAAAPPLSPPSPPPSPATTQNQDGRRNRLNLQHKSQISRFSVSYNNMSGILAALFYFFGKPVNRRRLLQL